MNSQNTSPDQWLGKLVWVFLRDDAGLPISTKAECGIVVDLTECWSSSSGPVWVVQVGDNYYHVWQGDMEIVEEWSEDLEGENSQMETAGKRPREHDRNSTK